MKPSSSTTSQASPSPLRSPQQTEDAAYQALVKEWCFAQAPEPTVNASVGVGGDGAGGRNDHSHRHGVGGGMGARRASAPGGSGSGGGGSVRLGGVDVGVVEG